MRTLLLSAAAALLFCATDVRAQAGTVPMTKPATTTKPTTKPAPTSKLDEQKRAISQELKNTSGTAASLLATAQKMAEGTEGEHRDIILKITDGIKIVQGDLNTQLGLVSKATDKNAESVFATAKDVNSHAIQTLDRLKGELPATKPAPVPVPTDKPMDPATK